MSDNSAIEWTDTTWNPTTGCDRISAGCDNCYALTMAKRLKAMGSAKYQTDGDPRTSGPGFGLAIHPDSLNDPFTWSKPRKVFVNSMSDLFHARVPLDFVRQVFEVMAATPQHTYQVLTKRASRLPKVADKLDWPPNVWMGTSVESANELDRVDGLRAAPAAVRFLSCEPLIGPLGDVDLTGIGWVIAGGESGPGARPMHPDWARQIRNRCEAESVPFFFKQWGAWAPWLSHPEGEEGPGDTFVNLDGDTGHVWFNEDLGYPTNCTRNWGETSFIMSRVGKKQAGRVLDGRTWDEFPEPVPA
jgi:protein gp37